MRAHLRAAVRQAICERRKGRGADAGIHPLWVVGKVLSRTINDHAQAQSVPTLGDASRAATEAVEGLFDDGQGVSIEEITEWIAQASEVLRSTEISLHAEGVSGMEVGTHLLVLSVRKLLELERLEPEAATALCLALNGLDDELFKRLRDDYGLRPAILGEIVRCFARMPGRVRHADLSARLKWGLAAAELDEKGLFNVGLRELQELPEAIAQRIGETHDGRGMGPCPDGRLVAPPLAVGRRIAAPGMFMLQGYRSLPRLRAESIFELGRLLAHTRQGVTDRNLTEAHQRFDEASVAFLATGDPITAAMAAIAATDCLARRLPIAVDGKNLGLMCQQALAYGAAVERQVLGSGIPPMTMKALLPLAKATKARARATQSVEALVEGLLSGPPTAAHLEKVQRLSQDDTHEAEMHFQVLLETASTEPWGALASGCAAILLHTTFIQDALRQVTPPEVLLAFITAIASAAAELRAPSRSARSALAPALRHHPLASPSRLFEAIGTLLRLSAANGQPLSRAHWRTLAETLVQIGIPSVELSILLRFEQTEVQALQHTLRQEAPGAPWHDYLRLRVRAIENSMAAPMHTASERALLSGWLTRLTTLLRDFDNGFRSSTPEEALWMLERTGASSFRAGTLWFGRGESGVPPHYMTRAWSEVTESFRAPLAAEDHVDSPLNMWQELLMARDWLDQYGRMKMSLEAGNLDPNVRAAFSELHSDPTQTWMAFPHETPPAYIQEVTGVPPESWEEKDSAIVVRFTPTSYAQICDQVDRARRRIARAVSRLCEHELLADGESLPDVSSDALRTLFVNRPGLGLLVPGSWPETHTPLTLFTSRQGTLIRLDTQAPLDLAEERAQGVDVLFTLRQAIQRDRKEASGSSFARLGEALRALREALSPWSRRLVSLLAREGVSELLILLRGMDFALIPWEDLDADESGGRLGERVVMGHVHSLAQLPSCPTSTRQGTVQLHGDGISAPLMRWGASGMHTLASVGVARAPLRGTEARDARKLQGELRTAMRLRLFLHGFHHELRPEADRITLVDGEGIDQRVDLKVEAIHALAVAGMDSVELWACEGGAYGRHLMEHGIAEEPEDLTIAFLHAGARRVISSRWHVPALPSALLMERFALLLEFSPNEAHALATTRAELRASFAPGGFIEQQVMALLTPPSDETVSLEGFEHTLSRAIDALRASWYAERALLPTPLSSASVGGSFERLIRYVPHRPKRRGETHENPVQTLVAKIQEALEPFRNATCWAGWRLTLRTLEDWRA